VSYEVEQKFPVAELAAVQERLVALGAQLQAEREDRDLYFAHPARDFARTDEALRIRRVGTSNFITYKVPNVDAATETRREIELDLPPGETAAAQWTELLESLGFRPVAEVRKRRRKASIAWQGREVAVALDDVDQLGTFVELELVTSRDDIEPAKAILRSLADALGLAGGERRSYLELLLARRRLDKATG